MIFFVLFVTICCPKCEPQDIEQKLVQRWVSAADGGLIWDNNGSVSRVCCLVTDGR